MGWFRDWRNHEHDWFPDLPGSEFIVTSSICLGCKARKVILPWGLCLNGGHPLDEHYNDDGDQVPHPNCPGPQ